MIIYAENPTAHKKTASINSWKKGGGGLYTVTISYLNFRLNRSTSDSFTEMVLES